MDAAFGSALVGGAIAGVFALAGVYVSHCLQVRREEERAGRRSREERANLAGALAAELDALWDRYMRTVGEELEKAERYEDFLVEWPVLSNYFSVFEGNTSKLGLLDSEDAALVVKTYVTGKGHLDSILVWGQHVREAQSAINQTERERLNSMLKAYFPHLKDTHTELKTLVDEVLPKLGRCKSAGLC